MHVGFLTTEYPPLPSGGIGTSLRNLARALVAAGHRVSVVGWGREAHYDDQGVSVRFLTSRFVPKTGWLTSRRMLRHELRRLVQQEGLDVVEAPDWCGLSAGIRAGCPMVIRCNGSAVYFGHLLRERVRPSVRLAEWLALRQADGVCAVSRFTAEQTARLFALKSPVPVVHNGVPLSVFERAPRERAEAGTVLYFGTVIRKKGAIDLCRAFSTVVSSMPSARLVIVGRDSVDRTTGASSTWQLCRRELSPGALARTEYVGERPYADIGRYIAKAAVCVFPSYAEALPMTWVEALASARPVVAYDVGWASEVVEHGRSGLLTPQGDIPALVNAVVRLLRNPAEASSMGDHGRSVAERLFSSDRVARSSLDWYREVIAGRGHA
jgi:glycosyltransferase involved in cell wall biosynthesis